MHPHLHHADAFTKMMVGIFATSFYVATIAGHVVIKVFKLKGKV